MRVKTEVYIIIFLVIVLIILAGAFIYYKREIPPAQNTNVVYCEFLAREFDRHVSDGRVSVPESECKNDSKVFIGGLLINKEECLFNDSINYFQCELIFKGQNQTGEVNLVTAKNNISYNVGSFYRFNIRNFCKKGETLSYFVDVNLTEFIRVYC